VTRDTLASLRTLASALPPGQAVPVPREWLLELLDGMPAAAPVRDLPAGMDLTCRQLADMLGRDGSTVRGWVSRGDFPGAYRLHGREWRIPADALHVWQEAQRLGQDPAGVRPPSVGRKPLPLSSWREAPPTAMAPDAVAGRGRAS
jgi:excisionase family DNA binding protein